MALIDSDGETELITQVDRHLRQGRIARPFAQAVDRAMHRRRARRRGGQHIGRRQAIVVVGVEVEPGLRKAPDHVAHGVRDPLRGHDPERIRQHEVGDTAVRQTLHQAVDIARLVLIAVGPVLQVDVDLEAACQGDGDRFAHVRRVFVQGLAELTATVRLAALGEQVQHPPPGAGDPLHAAPPVHEPQHLHALRQPARGRPIDDPGQRVLLPRRDPRRGHLDAVHPHQVQQRLGDVHLFVRGEGHPMGLLAVAKRRVHDQDGAGGVGHGQGLGKRQGSRTRACSPLFYRLKSPSPGVGRPQWL